MTFASTTGAPTSVLLIFNPTAGRRRRGLVDAGVSLMASVFVCMTRLISMLVQNSPTLKF